MVPRKGFPKQENPSLLDEIKGHLVIPLPLVYGLGEALEPLPF